MAVVTKRNEPTAGEWFCGGTDADESGIVSYGVLYFPPDKSGDMDWDVLADGLREADARLMAAAPDLRDALIKLVDTLNQYEGSHAGLDQAREAIEKATGKRMW